MRLIDKKDLDSLAKVLARSFTIVAPTKREDGECVFSEIGSQFKLDLDYNTTILPIKKFLFPSSEETFVFDKKKNKILPHKKEKKFVIFGLNLRDTEALVQLDEIMRRPETDYFYYKKRNAAVIVSVTNVTDPLPHTGIDLILEKINAKQYKAFPLSEEGRKIIKNKLFYTKEKVKFKTNPDSKTMLKLREALLDPELLKEAVEWSWRGKPEIWDKLSKQCLGCGVCTYACPLCYCFSVEDKCSLNGKKCTKTRNWDACTLPEFAKITGGHNFHRTLKERYYNWFYHKFVRAYGEYGKSQCVACGRCQKYCPAGIDIEKVLMEILTNYNKKKK